MNIFKKIKRFYYRFRNSDPLHHCPYHLNEGCVHVDGPLCDFPKCSIYNNYMGNEWVGCASCEYNGSCESHNYGLGCYEGKKINEEKV